MRILVRVAATQAAAEIRRLELQVAALERQLQRTAVAGNALGGAMSRRSFERSAQNLQFIGRQIAYNFTLPLAIAGGAALKFALDNEKAMTRVSKVYGDGSAVFNKLSQTEIPALAKAFRELSDEFGVNQAAVINIGADWAAAGASGLALAKVTRLTLETMVLGELDAAEATKALIAIQAQYGLVVEDTTGKVIDLKTTMGILNMVENQTGASFGDLVVAFSKSAGAARAAGVDVQHLAAQVAALVPAAGSASNAGNALKTIYSRLIKPTKEAEQAFQSLGIEFYSQEFQAKNVSQRLEEVANKYVNLTGAQKPLIATTLAGVFQFSRMSVLLEDIGSKTGYYDRALKGVTDSTNKQIDRQKVMNQYYKELGQVLASDPQRFKILMTQLQNMLAQIIIPLIPALLALSHEIVKVVDSFTNLNPAIQKMVLLAAFGLAIFGPFIRYIGAFGLLFSKMYGGALVAAKALGLIRKEVTLLTGETVLARVGLGAMMGEIFVLARAPFSAIAAGLGMVADAVVFMAKGVVKAFMWINRTLWLIFGDIIKAAWAMVAPMIQAALAAFLGWARAGLAAVLMGAKNILLAMGRFFFDMLVMAYEWGAKSVGFFTYIWEIISGVFYAGMAVVGEIWALGYGVLSTISALAMRSVIAVQALGLKALGAVTTAFGTFFTALWTSINMAIVSIQEFAGRALLAVYEGMQAAYLAVTQVFGRALVVVWEGIQAAVIAVQSAFRTAMVIVWASGLVAIEAITTTAATILPRIWAAMSFVMVAISELSFSKIIGLAATFLRNIGAMFAALPELLAGPIGWAILAAVALLVIFKDQIAEGIQYCIDNFNSLGPGIANFFKPVVDIFTTGIDYVMQGFNMLPAGVQNALIQVVKIVESAAHAVYELFSYFNPFAHHSPSLVEQVNAGVDVIAAKYASLGNIGRVFRQAIADLKAFGAATAGAVHAAERSKVADQRADVAKGNPQDLGAFDKLDASVQKLKPVLAAVAVEFGKQEAVVAKWKTRLDTVSGALDAAKNKLSILQKQADEAQDAIDSMNGTLELLNGQKLDLKQAGAGSDILGPIQDQIDQITKARDALNDGPIKAAAAQQAVVDKLQAQYDATNAAYDAEQKKLDALGQAYDAIESQINAMTSAMADFATMSKQASEAKAASGGAFGAKFDAAAAGGFADPGGTGRIGREGGFGDQSKQIMDLSNKWAEDASKSFGNFDILTPIKKKLHEAGDWIKNNVSTSIGAAAGAAIGFALLGPLGAILGGGIGALIGRVFDGKKFKKAASSVGSGIMQGLQPIFDWLSGAWDWISAKAQMVWDFIGKDILDALSAIWDGVTSFIGGVIEEFSKWGDLFQPVRDLFNTVVSFIQFIMPYIITIIKVYVGMLVIAFKLALDFLIPIIKPIFEFIKNFIVAALRFIHGVLQIVLGLITLNWGMVWNGIKNVFGGIWDAIKAIFTGAIGIVVGAAKGLWRALGGVWDLIKAGASSVGSGISSALTSIWGGIQEAAAAGVNGVIDIINGISHGINKVLGILHISYRIDDIGHVNWGKKASSVPSNKSGHDLHARGTAALSRVSGGFVTNGPRAIVGEGNPLFPEFVIPTDPSYRGRAEMLFKALGRHLGWPMMEDGGFLGSGHGPSISGTLGGAASAVGDAATKAGHAIYGAGKAVLSAAEKATVGKIFDGLEASAGGIPIQYAREFVKAGLHHIRDSIPGLATGGIVYPSPGGSVVRLAERGQRERVRIEPLGANDSGKKEYNFHGDLSFPNIKSGADAEEFLSNLEALVGD